MLEVILDTETTGLSTVDNHKIVEIACIETSELIPTKRIFHNFGMVRPEGYRKAKRLIKLAEKFNVPILTLIDTPGAYPGKGAEERGQAEAIARCIQTSLKAEVPIITPITKVTVSLIYLIKTVSYT